MSDADERNVEERLVESVVKGDSLSTAGFAAWDGMIEIDRCARINGEDAISRIGDEQEAAGLIAQGMKIDGEPFWSVYLHQAEGRVQCIGDFTTEAEANAFAAGLHVYRKYMAAMADKFFLRNRAKPYFSYVKCGNEQVRSLFEAEAVRATPARIVPPPIVHPHPPVRRRGTGSQGG